MDLNYLPQFKSVIEDIVRTEIKNTGITNYISAIVQGVNNDGTIDVYLPPNRDNLVTKLFNKTGEEINIGDSVEIATKSGSLSNAWIALKHGNTSTDSITQEKNSDYSNYLKNLGRHTEPASSTSASSPFSGLLRKKSAYLTSTYNDSNTPANYGNILTVSGEGSGQLLLEWSGSDTGTGHLYYRSHRDASTGGWRPWLTILDSSNYSSYALPLSGGTLTGDVTITGHRVISNSSVSWYQGRRYAPAVNSKTTDSGFHPVSSAKSKNGDWAIGTLGSNDNLYFVYTTDTNYSSGTNTTTNVALPATAGTLALTSQIPTNVAHTNVNNNFTTSQTVAGNVYANGGYLYNKTSGIELRIGATNSSFIHFVNNTNSVPFWFNKDVKVQGNLYGGSNYDKLVAYAEQLPSYSNGSLTTTKSSGYGNITSATYRQWGKVVYLEIVFNTSGGTTTVGNNIWSGKISGVTLPYYRATGCGYYSGSHYIAGLYGSSDTNNAGRMDIRALGKDVAKNSDSHSLSITYIIP